MIKMNTPSVHADSQGAQGKMALSVEFHRYITMKHSDLYFSILHYLEIIYGTQMDSSLNPI